MIFQSTRLGGVLEIDVEPRADDRGFLARTWCVDEFAANGIPNTMVQASTILTHRRGTLRGLHYQIAPHAEDKLVRCTLGAAYVVVVDLRPESPTWRQWIGVELSSANRRELFVPRGCAQGYQTLVDGTEMYYLMSTRYVPEAARGVRFDDPAFGIVWPLEVAAISDRDQSWADYDEPSSSFR